MTNKEIQYKNVTIRIHKPEIVEEERKQIEANIIRVMEQVGKELIRNQEKQKENEKIVC